MSASSAKTKAPFPAGTGLPKSLLAGVRYSLADMLGEIRQELESSAFSREKLDQAEIRQLFKNQARSRAKSKK